VVMALATTLMAPPLLKWALKRVAVSEEEQERLDLAQHRSIFDKRTLRILIPTAGGPNALTALRIAAPLATSADATITTLFVTGAEASRSRQSRRSLSDLWRWSPKYDEPTQTILQLGRQYGVNVDTKIIQAGEERATEVILREAQRGYDLILLGASGSRHPLRGKFVEGLLTDSPAPCAVLKSRGEKLKYERLLVPTSSEGDVRLAIEFAAMYAEDAAAQVTLFHVVPLPEQTRRFFRRRQPPLGENTLKLMADTLLWELRPRRAKSQLHMEAQVVEDEHPTLALLREVQRGTYDLLIVSSPLRLPPSPHRIDPITEQIVNEAPCTVIVITPQQIRPRFPH